MTRVESTRESPIGCALVNNVFTCTGRDIFQSESTAGTLSGFAGRAHRAGNVLFVRPEFEFSMAGEHMRMGGTSSAIGRRSW